MIYFMTNNILGWFNIIDSKIWNDRLYPNPYLSTISIMFVTLCGSFMDQYINEYVKDTHILGLTFLFWSVTIAESIMTASKPLIGVVRSLLLSVLIFISFWLGKQLPSIVTQSIVLTWMLASIFEVIFIGIGKTFKSSNSTTKVSTYETVSGEDKMDRSHYTNIIIFLALVYIISTLFIKYSGHYPGLSSIIFFYNRSEIENTLPLIFITLSYAGWFITILSGIYNNIRLMRFGVILTIPIFSLLAIDAFKDYYYQLEIGSYLLLAISLIALIISFIHERRIPAKGKKDKISVQTCIIVFLAFVYIVSMLVLDFADHNYINAKIDLYTTLLFSSDKGRVPLILIVLSYIGWFIAVFSEIYNYIVFKRFGIILTFPIFLYFAIASLTKRQFDLESGSYVLLAISLIALIISFIPEEKIDKAIKELK